MQLHKADELESLIKGIEFVAANNADECYYYDSPLNSSKCRKVIWYIIFFNKINLNNINFIFL